MSAPHGEAMPSATLFNTREAAQFLRLSVSTLERKRGTGTGPRFLKLGPGKRARVAYRQSDLMAWLAGLQYQSTAEYGRTGQHR